MSETVIMVTMHSPQKMDVQVSTRQEHTKNGPQGILAVMLTQEKEALARRNDTSKAAIAIRTRAARYAMDLEQSDIAAAVGIRNTAYSNMELALSFTSRDVMAYFYREHGIDFNFLIAGDYSRIASDVQDKLFPALERATIEWDRREGSGRS